MRIEDLLSANYSRANMCIFVLSKIIMSFRNPQGNFSSFRSTFIFPISTLITASFQPGFIGRAVCQRILDSLKQFQADSDMKKALACTYYSSSQQLIGFTTPTAYDVHDEPTPRLDVSAQITQPTCGFDLTGKFLKKLRTINFLSNDRSNHS